jgi:hypothetical protein
MLMADHSEGGDVGGLKDIGRAGANQEYSAGVSQGFGG